MLKPTKLPEEILIKKEKELEKPKEKEKEKIKEPIEKPSIEEGKENKFTKAESMHSIDREREGKETTVARKTNEFVPRFYFPAISMHEGNIPEEIIVEWSNINYLILDRIILTMLFLQVKAKNSQ